MLLVFCIPLLVIARMLRPLKQFVRFEGLLVQLASSIYLASPYGKSRWLGITLARRNLDAGRNNPAQLILLQLERQYPTDVKLLWELLRTAVDDESVLRIQLRLQEIIGDDPYLLFRISRTYENLKDFSSAEQFAMRAAELVLPRLITDSERLETTANSASP